MRLGRGCDGIHQMREACGQLLTMAEAMGFSLRKPWRTLPESVRHAILFGTAVMVSKGDLYGTLAVGGLTLANIRRGVAQAGAIGYWVGAPFARQGYMTAAMRALIPFCFGTLRLHRLEAACIPSNAASIALLEKTGFRREGYARSYLCINGIWQDHLLYARLQSDPRT